MEHELNQIIEAFTSSHFQVQGVYRYRIPANSSGTQRSAPFPGFVCANNRPVSGDKGNFMNISAYIQENYAEEISIGVLADIFGMSANQLYYLYAKHADMGPGDYLIAYRLNRARELLLTTDLFIHEIAHAVGYEDPLYFSRIFKQRFGNSPQQLRKVFRNNP